MALYEHRIEAFDARGGDAYLDRFAEYLEMLFDQGWSVLERSRDMACSSWWSAELFREQPTRAENARPE